MRFDAQSGRRVAWEDFPVAFVRGWRGHFVQVGPVTDFALGDGVTALTVTLEVQHRAHRVVLWSSSQLVPERVDLRVKLGEVAVIKRLRRKSRCQALCRTVHRLNLLH